MATRVSLNVNYRDRFHSAQFYRDVLDAVPDSEGEGGQGCAVRLLLDGFRFLLIDVAENVEPGKE